MSQIDRVFAADLSGGTEPRKKTVVALMRSDKVLHCMSNSQLHIKKVLDRARYLHKTQPTIDPEDLPEETASQRTAAYIHTVPDKPPSSIESGRVKWAQEETDAIQEVLKNLSKCPNKGEIQKLFSSITILKRILKENTDERVKNKVKNEFRRLQK